MPGVDDGGDVLTGSDRCRLMSCSGTAVVGDRTRVVGGGVDGFTTDSSYKRVLDRSSCSAGLSCGCSLSDVDVVAGCCC